MKNAVTFGAQADVYAAARPHYPDDLFDWIAGQAPGVDLAWDVGTGSGQAALSLAKRFARVHATDLDAAQIKQAPERTNINFAKAPSHDSGLASGTVDAVTAATALHWFNFEKFWPEVRRVALPGGIFCAWTYHRCDADEQTQNHLLGPVMKILEPYWAEGNRISWRGYIQDDVQMPFERIKTPKFSCELDWTPKQIVAYLKSWSAHKKARLDGHTDGLAKIEHAAIEGLGDDRRRFSLPLHVLAARVE